MPIHERRTSSGDTMGGKATMPVDTTLPRLRPLRCLQRCALAGILALSFGCWEEEEREVLRPEPQGQPADAGLPDGGCVDYEGLEMAPCGEFDAGEALDAGDFDPYA